MAANKKFKKKMTWQPIPKKGGEAFKHEKLYKQDPNETLVIHSQLKVK
jgi:hypothetical protein